jgi:hypothetical protein
VKSPTPLSSVPVSSLVTEPRFHGHPFGDFDVLDRPFDGEGVRYRTDAP